MTRQPSRKISFGRRILFGLASLLLALILLEVVSWAALRFAMSLASPLSFSAQQRREVIDEYNRPAGDHKAKMLSDQVVHPYIGYVIDPTGKTDVSRLGFHGSQDPILKRSTDRVIVAVVGGSFARDFVTSVGDETLFELLGESASFAGKQFICLNLAMSGYKQPQQLMVINYLMALGGEFDIVINIDGFNEVALHGPENRRKGIAPSYPRIWNMRLDPLADPVARRLAAQHMSYVQQRAHAAQQFSGAPWRFSCTSQLVWQLIDGSLKQRAWQASKAFMDYQPTTETRFVVTGPGEPFGDDDAARYRHLVELWRQGSLLLHNQCIANDVRYYHFLQPNQYLAGSKPLNDQEREDAYNESVAYRDGVIVGYPQLIEAGKQLRQAGVAFTDLTQIFAGNDNTIYNDTCCHVNEDGNRIVAQRIAEAILNER